ncbi:unnamed protein product [Spirodela intermedia]|uniref:Tubby-like F-box protein n=1 Tax=Spirodela intermedia TaxID=51605 RepID=A0A7I8JUE1_SPIIN|nr:unnamed protein product [Spirodela intermedia]CAA6673714.1 unnamed protein product [Spirodela intermedia]
MNLREIVRDGIGSISRRGFSHQRRKEREGARSASSSASFVDLGVEAGEQGSWSGLPPELLREVVVRLEESEATWPSRRNLVAFGSVCRSWRRICREIVGLPEVSGKLTFPVSLKQPGFRNATIQCYIKRNKSTSTYQLFLGLQPESGKFLLTARKIRRPTHAEYIISMATHDISRSSVSYVGKLRSNFLGTKFAIYDSQPPMAAPRKVSPKVPSGSFGIAHISYELNMLGTRGPRRMRCTMHSIPAAALDPITTNTTSAATTAGAASSLEDSFSRLSLPRSADSKLGASWRFGDSARFMESSRFSEVSVDVVGKEGPLVLRNKAPRWHEQLQCWCLNFRGRVTVASVKNFQLISAATEPAGGGEAGDHDKIILQFGKIGKDLFTMDYRYPLSAFQAFGICLSSFDTKLACE